MPIMLLAIAIAVLPVLLMSISEARAERRAPGRPRARNLGGPNIDTIANGGGGGRVWKAA